MLFQVSARPGRMTATVGPPVRKPSNSKEIFRHSLSSIRDSVIDITLSATPRRYRFFDCREFVNNSLLSITEYVDPDRVKYAAISYVWRGNPADAASRAMDRLGTFAVTGAEDGDPISMDVLLQVCKAALQESVSYLWLDRLSIMQTSKDDKHWQIERMNGIYKKCEICLVLPGGIRRLVSLEDNTSWICRAWTLQEVMVPKRVKVLFSWKYGSIVGSGGTNFMSGFDTITPYQCSMATMTDMITLTFGGITVTTSCGAELRLAASIIGGESNRPVHALMGAMNDEGADIKAQAIWKSAVMRTSSRPVDMVFSIMGLFGVTLDTKSFGSQDRQGATIALATKILENGGKASWLGPTFFLPPDPRLSAFPTFPKSTVSGGAYIRIGNEDKPAEDVMENTARWLEGLPKGSMSSTGRFTFKARAAHLIPTGLNRLDPSSANETIDQCFIGSQMYLTAMDGSVWQLDTTGGDISAGEHFVIFLGTLQHYNHTGLGNYEDIRAMRALLIEVEGLGTARRKSYFVLGNELEGMIKYWNKRTFTLGSATVVESAMSVTRTNISVGWGW